MVLFSEIADCTGLQGKFYFVDQLVDFNISDKVGLVVVGLFGISGRAKTI